MYSYKAITRTQKEFESVGLQRVCYTGLAVNSRTLLFYSPGTIFFPKKSMVARRTNLCEL